MRSNTNLTHHRGRRQAGFTLIELLVAIATVAILFGLLPAVQRAREVANQKLADTELKSFAAKIAGSYQTGGKLPASLAEIAGSGDARHGHRLTAVEITGSRVRLAFEPIPGVTGSQTGLLEAAVGPAGLATSIKWTPTPGAADGRARMFSDAAGAAAHGIGRMVGWAMQDFHFRALAALKGETESNLRQQEVFNTLRGRDGRVSFGSIAEWANTNQSPFRIAFQETWQDFHRTLRLGALGENIAALPGIASLPAVQKDDRLLSFTVLGRLSSVWVGEPELKAQLLDALKGAEAADVSGDVLGRNAALDRYIGAVAAGEQRAFSWGAPAPLVSLDSLKCLAEAMKN